MILVRLAANKNYEIGFFAAHFLAAIAGSRLRLVGRGRGHTTLARKVGRRCARFRCGYALFLLRMAGKSTLFRHFKMVAWPVGTKVSPFLSPDSFAAFLDGISGFRRQRALAVSCCFIVFAFPIAAFNLAFFSEFARRKKRHFSKLHLGRVSWSLPDLDGTKRRALRMERQRRKLARFGVYRLYLGVSALFKNRFAPLEKRRVISILAGSLRQRIGLHGAVYFAAFMLARRKIARKVASCATVFCGGRRDVFLSFVGLARYGFSDAGQRFLEISLAQRQPRRRFYARDKRRLPDAIADCFCGWLVTAFAMAKSADSNAPSPLFEGREFGSGGGATYFLHGAKNGNSVG